MPRPRTKGPTISIRLTQHADDLLRIQAEEVRMPAATLAATMLEGLLDPAPPRSSRPTSRPHAETCNCSMCRPKGAK